jgi:hypothetical protein
VPGGLGYGYNVLPRRIDGKTELRGSRAIEETAAAVVRGIFEGCANGTSPEAIARALNAEGVPGPAAACGRTRRSVAGRCAARGS